MGVDLMDLGPLLHEGERVRHDLEDTLDRLIRDCDAILADEAEAQAHTEARRRGDLAPPGRTR